MLWNITYQKQKGNRLLIHVTSRMTLQRITLSEKKANSERLHPVHFQLYDILEMPKIIEMDNILVVVVAGGR